MMKVDVPMSEWSCDLIERYMAHRSLHILKANTETISKKLKFLIEGKRRKREFTLENFKEAVDRAEYIAGCINTQSLPTSMQDKILSYQTNIIKVKESLSKLSNQLDGKILEEHLLDGYHNISSINHYFDQLRRIS